MARHLTLKRPAGRRPVASAERPEESGASVGAGEELRAELVARLRAEVESGTYRPDPRDVAEALLRDLAGRARTKRC